MVMNSKSLLLYMRLILTKDGNSFTQGPHHVAHTFIKRNLSELFFKRSFTPASSIISSVTGFVAHSLSDLATRSSFSAHFIEQPKTFVVFVGTSLPASNASMAFCASLFLGIPVCFSTSSIRPWYLNLRSLSKIKTWGVATGP